MNLDLIKKIEKQKIYEGKHNICYSFFYKNKKYFLREVKNKIVNHENEMTFIKNTKKDFIINENIFIRPYWEAYKMKKNNLSNLKKIRNYLEKNIWNTKCDLKITNKVFFETNIKDKKYLFLIDKYLRVPNKDFVITHGDLRKKNILILKNKKQIEIIDFEWLMYNDKYFDLAHLFLYCNWNKKDINKVFKIDKNKLDDFIYITKKFNDNFESENY